MAPFRDFIPAGEDTEAQGDGFKDFVAPKEPEEEKVKLIEKGKKGGKK